MKTLTHEQARRVYDRIGRRQDSQGFYEDRALDILVEHGQFGEAKQVFELGCGTGRLALRLLSDELPEDALYRGIDLSRTMIGLSEERLAPFAGRALVHLTHGSFPLGEPDDCCDRFVSTYVLDLLSEEDIAEVLEEAHRMLVPGGLLCLASLSTGSSPASRALARIWSGVHRISPSLVGGCRPIELKERLPRSRWTIRHHECVAPFAVPSEVIVAVHA